MFAFGSWTDTSLWYKVDKRSFVIQRYNLRITFDFKIFIAKIFLVEKESSQRTGRMLWNSCCNAIGELIKYTPGNHMESIYCRILNKISWFVLPLRVTRAFSQAFQSCSIPQWLFLLSLQKMPVRALHAMVPFFSTTGPWMSLNLFLSRGLL